MAQSVPKRAYDLNPYAAGYKAYLGTRRSPNKGMKLQKAGYIQREMQNKANKRAAMRRLKANAIKNYGSKYSLGGGYA